MREPLILLDFDGVCADTEELARQSVAEVLAEHCWVPRDEVLDLVLSRPGMTLLQLMDEISTRFGLSLSATDRVSLARANEARTIASFRRTGLSAAPGFIEALASVRYARGAHLRIGSNSSHRRLAAALDALDHPPGEASPVRVGLALRRLVDEVHAATLPKPDAQVYSDAVGGHLARFGHLPALVMILDDSPSGLKGGIAARQAWPEVPVFVVGYLGLVHRPDEVRPQLEGLGLHRVVDQIDWSFLPPLLDEVLAMVGPRS